MSQRVVMALQGLLHPAVRCHFKFVLTGVGLRAEGRESIRAGKSVVRRLRQRPAAYDTVGSSRGFHNTSGRSSEGGGASATVEMACNVPSLKF